MKNHSFKTAEPSAELVMSKHCCVQSWSAPVVVSLMMWVSSPAMAQNTLAPTTAKPKVVEGQAMSPSFALGQAVRLRFVDADIAAVARIVATLTGLNLVVDPRVKGSITLETNGVVPPTVALHLFSAQLRTQGFAMVDAGSHLTVLPEAEAKLHSGPVLVGSSAPGQGTAGQVLTRIFKLSFESATQLIPVLRPLISPNQVVTLATGSNALIITDYSDNLVRLEQIIKALDVPSTTGVDIIPLKNSIASDVAVTVQRLLETSNQGNTMPAQGGSGMQLESGSRTVVLADSRANALMVRGPNPARLSQARLLIEQLDQPGPVPSSSVGGNIYVVHLKNADATKLAVTLRAAMAEEGRGTGGMAPAVGNTGNPSTSPATAALSATGGFIQADTTTNSLIITAPEPRYRQLRAVIDRLDQRRAQVFVESLIAEVSADKAAEFGVQWQGMLGQAGDGSIGLLGTNFKVGSNSIASMAQNGSAALTLPSGLNIGVLNQTNGVYVLGMLARFLQTSGEANVLSTPTLLTLDNEEAKIVIGQNVPFVTGQYTSNAAGNTAGNVNPFQTIERKDVGLTLKVKPQISENGTVKMQIFQEVSRIDSNSSSGLITNKRSIESSVLVDDGSIVVLGGLLQDDSALSEEKIPGLGDVPVFGNLFRSGAKSRKKTNLMVFLRPLVIRSKSESDSFALGRYEQMRLEQMNAQAQEAGVLSQGGAVLPQLSEKPVLTAPMRHD
jgi:general secretion pathway protein D